MLIRLAMLIRTSSLESVSTVRLARKEDMNL
jgi:hypothetical protein